MPVLGWARDPELLDAVNSGGARLLERVVVRSSKPNAEAGAPMFPPPWHDCRIQFLDGHRVQIASSTVAPTLPGQRELFLHAPWAYGVAVRPSIQIAIATLLAASEVGATDVHLGRGGPGVLVDRITALDSWAMLYWQLRFERIVYSESQFAAVPYHVENDLEAAIAL